MARMVPLIAGLLLVAGAQAAPARPAHYRQAPDPLPAALADAPGQIVAGNCAGCHSLDYITTQPRGKGAQFWRDEVTKMVNVYKAPLAPADADTVAGILDHKFGGAG